MSGPYEKTRERREALSVAQIYAVKGAKSFPTGDSAVVVQIGDPRCAPHLHGIRASRDTWVEIFAQLAAADPFIAERVRARAA
jgi:hypothetical protein